MADLTRPQLALCIAGAMLAVVLGVHQLRRSPGGEAVPAAPPIRIGASDGGRVLVHVAGAVRRPGVYRFSAGARVNDAVRRAGGATRKADLGGLNLAAK